MDSGAGFAALTSGCGLDFLRDVKETHLSNGLPVVYRAGVILVALAMVLLPCIYIALTVLAGWSVYWFASHHFLEIWEWHLGSNRVALAAKVVCSVTPLLVGGTIALFMVKPLFARRAAPMQPLAVNPEMEPRLCNLIAWVCQTVGAPVPKRIELDCDVNASAGFDRGFRGFFRNDLVLTIGLPLVCGITQRELAGIVAHEFGHFRQGAGMRFSFLIRRVNGWFARVVYERDGWDETIESWAAGAEGWVALMVACARGGVWASRLVLRCLMYVGHAICAVLLRQMEYDADRSEMRISGSAALESAMVKISVLATVYGDIGSEMRRLWRSEHRLPDNIPVYLAHLAEHLPGERRHRIENAVGLGKTKLLDTHPCTADRIRQARLLAEPGYDISDEPARDLFENFAAISRLVTLAYYNDDLNVPTTPDFLIPVERLVCPPASVPVEPAVPMMAYDPAAFQEKAPQ